MGSDELDKILDSALSSYADEEPRPGLEGRVLNRIRASRDGHRFAWLRWPIAIPAFACFLVLALTLWTKRDSTPKPSKPTPTIAKAAPVSPTLSGAAQIAVSR